MNEFTIRFENWQKALRETVPIHLRTSYRSAMLTLCRAFGAYDSIERQP
jgi:hypothetical protein